MRFYAHALIDAGSDTDIAAKLMVIGGPVAPDVIPDRPSIGFVGGLEILTQSRGFGARTVRLEGGLYPAANEIAGFGVQVGLGFLIGSVKR